MSLVYEEADERFTTSASAEPAIKKYMVLNSASHTTGEEQFSTRGPTGGTLDPDRTRAGRILSTPRTTVMGSGTFA